jgi:hypothetical protein
MNWLYALLSSLKNIVVKKYLLSSVPIFPIISKGCSAAHAVMSHLGIENGFLVYTVCTIDSNNNMHRRVIVDAGNGKVLSNQQIPMREAMMMHGGGMMMAL